MIDTGATLSLATKTLHEKGAKAIYALITHGMLRASSRKEDGRGTLTFLDRV